eukprot:scaffold99909_cov69-Phaeocystis_antarctica.AAC.3
MVPTRTYPCGCVVSESITASSPCSKKKVWTVSASCPSPMSTDERGDESRLDVRPLPLQQRVKPRARDDRCPEFGAHIERGTKCVAAHLALLLLHLGWQRVHEQQAGRARDEGAQRGYVVAVVRAQRLEAHTLAGLEHRHARVHVVHLDGAVEHDPEEARVLVLPHQLPHAPQQSDP